MRYPLLLLAALLAPTAHAADPKAIYQGTCIACHGAHAEGAFPGVPNLAKTGRLAKPAATLVDSIMNGMQSPGSPLAMPAKGGTPTLTAADAEALVGYLRTLAPAK
jgi:mono/diheme cytochrome c family protein